MNWQGKHIWRLRCAWQDQRAPVPGQLPVMFGVGGLSCDSVEYPFGPGDGFGQLLPAVATRSGMVLFRTDKAGTGDSEGPDCSDLDFQTELAGFRASFNALQNYDF